MKKLTFTALLSATLASLTLLATPVHADDDDDDRGWRHRGQGHQIYHGHPGYHPRSHWEAREYRRVQRERYRQWQWQQRQAERAWHAPRYDRDGDGVPNRYDRRPHNPYRY